MKKLLLTILFIQAVCFLYAQLYIAPGDSLSVLPGTLFTLQEDLQNNGKIYSNGVLTLNSTVPQNISGSGNADNITASGIVLMQSDVLINNVLQLDAGSTFSLGSFQLTNNGSITGAGLLRGSANAGLVLNGNSSTLIFDQSNNEVTNALKTISINNGGTVLQNKLYVYDAMLPGVVTVTLNDEVILRSNSSKTARVGPVAAGFLYNTNGKFVVERYIPGRRAWRLLTAPVTPSSNVKISDAWQDGKPRVTNTNIISNPEPGYGTHVTFGMPATNGYDQGINGNPSIRYLNSSGWNGIPSATNDGSTLNSGIITDQPGYMLFVRGDRGTLLSQATGAATSPTVLRPKGRINTGTMNLPLSAPFGNFRVINNPYPSAVNFHAVINHPVNAANGFADAFYLWDPNITGSNSVGGFVAMSYNAAASIAAGRPVYDGSVPSSISNNGDIQSGSAFLIEYAGAATTLRVEENHKSVESNNTFFRPLRQMQAVLNAVNSDSSISVNDGVLLTFDENSNDDIDRNDMNKPGNFAENIALQSHDRLLSIERRKPLSINDRIQFFMNRMRQKTYRLDIAFAANSLPDGAAALLVDSFLNTQAALNTSDTSQYFFEVTAEAASAQNTRFKIILKAVNQFEFFNALLLNEDVQLQWILKDTMGLLSFTVERSADSVLFTPIKNTTAFNFADVQLSAGSYFYRIKCANETGVVSYSSIKKVVVPYVKAGMHVYPNPVTGSSFTLRSKNEPAGVYRLRLLGNDGKEIFTNAFLHNGGVLQQIQHIPAAIARGMYQLEVLLPDKKTYLLKVIVQR